MSPPADARDGLRPRRPRNASGAADDGRGPKLPKQLEISGPAGALPIRADDEAGIDLLMLIEGETSGRPLDEVLAKFGRARSTYYEKLRRFRDEGVQGLLARPPGPRAPWRRPLEVVRFVVTTRLRHPDRTAAEVADELARLGHRVSVRSVERTLTHFGLTRSFARHVAAPPPPSTPEGGE